LAGRLKQPGERRFRARSSFDGGVEAEFPALRALQMSEIAVAHFLRQRPVGRLPEWGSQCLTHGVLLSGCEAPTRRAWRTKPARSRQRWPDARLPASGPCGQRAPARTILRRSKRFWFSCFLLSPVQDRAAACLQQTMNSHVCHEKNSLIS